MAEIVNTVVFPIIRTDYILRALRTLHEHTPPNFKVIVVDQTRPSGVFEHELRQLCDLHIKTKKNYGFAQASNFGIRLAPTQYITVSNCDVEFLPGWWEGIMETFERFPTALAVNPMSPREPGWGYGQEGYIQHCTLQEARNPETIERLKEERNWQVVDGIVTWCTVFRADLLDEVGLFDERFFPGSGEDYDLNGRAYVAGYRMLATSRSWVWHWWSRSKDGREQALPDARPAWNRLGELWPDGFDMWGRKNGTMLTRVSNIARSSL